MFNLCVLAKLEYPANTTYRTTSSEIVYSTFTIYLSHMHFKELVLFNWKKCFLMVLFIRKECLFDAVKGHLVSLLLNRTTAAPTIVASQLYLIVTILHTESKTVHKMHAQFATTILASSPRRVYSCPKNTKITVMFTTPPFAMSSCSSIIVPRHVPA